MPNGPYHAYVAIQMLRRCAGRVKHVSAAFSLLSTLGKTSLSNVNNDQRFFLCLLFIAHAWALRR